MPNAGRIRKTVIAFALLTSILTVASAGNTQQLKIIRGYELPPGKRGCLPKGAYSRSSVTYCRESSFSTTVQGRQGSLITYTTPTGDFLTVFSPEWVAGSCSIYRKKNCPVLAAFNNSDLKKMSVLLDKDLEELTVISYASNGVRLFSIVEDRR